MSVRMVRDAIYAGIVAATVSITIETPILWFVYGETQWAAARMTAAIVLGEGVLFPPIFDVRLIALASVIHVALSILYGLVLAPVVHRLGSARAVCAGGVYGLVLYAVNLHGIAPIFFPWFLELQTGLTVFSHIVFGVTLSGSYVLLRRR